MSSKEKACNWGSQACRLAPCPPLEQALGRRLDAEKGANKSFENVSCMRRNQKFFKEGAQNIDMFLSVFFSGRINSKQVEEQKKGSRRSVGMLPLKCFENSRTVMPIFGQTLLKFFAPKFECFTGIGTWRSTNRVSHKPTR